MIQKEEKQKKFRGSTMKPNITKNKSKGVKINVDYNDDGIEIGDGSIQLVSYLGVLARTMVPVDYLDWRLVPDELKEKLWDIVQV